MILQSGQKINDEHSSMLWHCQVDLFFLFVWNLNNLHVSSRMQLKVMYMTMHGIHAHVWLFVRLVWYCGSQHVDLQCVIHIPIITNKLAGIVFLWQIIPLQSTYNKCPPEYDLPWAFWKTRYDSAKKISAVKTVHHLQLQYVKESSSFKKQNPVFRKVVFHTDQGNQRFTGSSPYLTSSIYDINLPWAWG